MWDFDLQVIPGREGQSIEALVWQGQRLFSAGLDGNVNEIDLIKLQIKVMAECCRNLNLLNTVFIRLSDGVFPPEYEYK